MARLLRIEKVGGWYHVTARGNERKAIFRDDTERRHFLEIVAEMVRRFGLCLHCFVLLDNWETIQEQVVLGGAEFLRCIHKLSLIKRLWAGFTEARTSVSAATDNL